MKNKIAFISTDWNDNEYRKANNAYGGVSYYRLIKPMQLLREKYDVTFYGSDINKLSKGKRTDEFYDLLTRTYNMIIVKQIDNATSAQALIHWCNHNKCILVQDFDDDMLSVRDDQPASKMGYTLGGNRRAYSASMMSLADALIVSTQPLKESFTKVLKDVFNEDKDIYVFPNYNDVKDWKYKQPKRSNEKIVIGWMGSVTHDADLKLVMPALAVVLDMYENVYLELLGGIMQGSLAYLLQDFSIEAKKRIRIVFGTPAFDTYPKLVMTQKWDIGIAPLIDDAFNKSKTHIKWMEYTMMNIPTIASDVYPYTENIPKDTALIVKDNGWIDALCKLIEDDDLRDTLLNNAREYIHNNLQWEQHREDYVRIVGEIFNKHTTK